MKVLYSKTAREYDDLHYCFIVKDYNITGWTKLSPGDLNILNVSI